MKTIKLSKIKSKNYNKQLFINKLNQINTILMLSLSISGDRFSGIDKRWLKHIYTNHFSWFELHLLKRYCEIKKYDSILIILNDIF